MHNGRNFVRILQLFVRLSVLGLFIFAAGAASAQSSNPPAERNVVVVFKDGHRQSFSLSDVARIEMKSPSMIVFKDGRQQNIAAADISRIEFETDPGTASMPGRAHFLGKWKVGNGNGGTFFITLEENGEARKSIGERHGTWSIVNGEAHIAWDDGWHDAIRRVGMQHQKFAFQPGKSFEDPPSNVTTATNTNPSPI